eukprot:403359716
MRASSLNYCSLATLLILFLSLQQVTANINSIHDLRLTEEQFIYKYRFVFSDFKPKSHNRTENLLENAIAEVDLRLTSHNYPTNESYKFYFFLAEYTQAVNLATQLEKARLGDHLNYAQDIDNILKPFIGNFPIYTSMIIDESNKEYVYQKSNNIYQEGVYYAIMIYSRNLPDFSGNNSNQSAQYEHDHDSLFKDPTTYTIQDTDKYISVSGIILYKNTWGYLNAERQPLLAYYSISALTFFVICFIWLIICTKHRENLIFLHHFISVILVSQLIQSLFMVVEVYVLNQEGQLVFSFVFINILFSVCRNTFARVLTLLVALGFGIVITPQEAKDKYRTKIIILSVLYAITNGLSQHQVVKFLMMRRFVVMLVVTYIIAFCGLVLELYYKFQGDRNQLWHFEWIIESFWFTLFSVFLIVMMIMMKPNAHSKQLAMMQQIGADMSSANESGSRPGGGDIGQAEALTEQPEDDLNSIELSDFGSQNKKKQKQDEVRRLNNNFMHQSDQPQNNNNGADPDYENSVQQFHHGVSGGKKNLQIQITDE